MKGIETLDNIYDLIAKDSKDIIEDLELSKEDEVLYESVIDNLENKLYEDLKAEKIVSVPFMGNFKPRFRNKVLSEIHEDLTKYYKEHGKDGYGEFRVGLIRDGVFKKEYEFYVKQRIEYLKKFKLKDKYNYLCETESIEFADLYIRLYANMKPLNK